MRKYPEYDDKANFLNEAEISINEELARYQMFKTDNIELGKFIDNWITWQCKQFEGIPFHELQSMFEYIQKDPSKLIAEEECASAFDLSKRILR